MVIIMDPITHALAGVTLGIVATQIPGFKENPNIVLGVGITSSVIPDIDVITKLFKNKNYIRYHRNATHSLMGLPFLALIAPLVLFPFTENISFLALYLFSLICIVFHSFLDLLNPYGTRILPKRTFISYGVIYTFDPIFLFLLLSGAFSFFISIYLTYQTILIMVSYFILRLIIQTRIKKKLSKMFPDAKKIFVLSRVIIYDWNVIIEFDDHFLVANYCAELRNIDQVEKKDIPNQYKPLISFLKEYRAFTSISYCYNVEINEYPEYTEITLLDLKYRKKNFYYFRAIFRIKDNKLLNSYIGWVFSMDKFNKKVEKNIAKEYKNEHRKNQKKH